MRTSLTHPLRIDELDCRPHANGVIGLTLCPGKQGDSLYGTPWARDLAVDLAAVARWQPALMLTLVEAREMGMLGVPGLGDAARAQGLVWQHVPIPDTRAPGPGFEAIAREPLQQALGALRAGQRVLVHCRGGLGRAGTIAAALLIELGEDPAGALQRVRVARPGAVETAEQERYLRHYRPWLGE